MKEQSLPEQEKTSERREPTPQVQTELNGPISMAAPRSGIDFFDRRLYQTQGTPDSPSEPEAAPIQMTEKVAIKMSKTQNDRNIDRYNRPVRDVNVDASRSRPNVDDIYDIAKKQGGDNYDGIVYSYGDRSMIKVTPANRYELRHIIAREKIIRKLKGGLVGQSVHGALIWLKADRRVNINYTDRTPLEYPQEYLDEQATRWLDAWDRDKKNYFYGSSEGNTLAGTGFDNPATADQDDEGIGYQQKYANSYYKKENYDWVNTINDTEVEGLDVTKGCRWTVSEILWADEEYKEVYRGIKKKTALLDYILDQENYLEDLGAYVRRHIKRGKSAKDAGIETHNQLRGYFSARGWRREIVELAKAYEPPQQSNDTMIVQESSSVSSPQNNNVIMGRFIGDPGLKRESIHHASGNLRVTMERNSPTTPAPPVQMNAKVTTVLDTTQGDRSYYLDSSVIKTVAVYSDRYNLGVNEIDAIAVLQGGTDNPGIKYQRGHYKAKSSYVLRHIIPRKEIADKLIRGLRGNTIRQALQWLNDDDKIGNVDVPDIGDDPLDYLMEKADDWIKAWDKDPKNYFIGKSSGNTSSLQGGLVKYDDPVVANRRSTENIFAGEEDGSDGDWVAANFYRKQDYKNVKASGNTRVDRSPYRVAMVLAIQKIYKTKYTPSNELRETALRKFAWAAINTRWKFINTIHPVLLSHLQRGKTPQEASTMTAGNGNYWEASGVMDVIKKNYRKFMPKPKPQKLEFKSKPQDPDGRPPSSKRRRVSAPATTISQSLGF